MLVPGYTVKAGVHEFDDFHVEDEHLDPSGGCRAEIHHHTQRRIAFVHVDPRSNPEHLEATVCHELVHIMLQDSHIYAEANIDLMRREELNDKHERDCWAIADLYLAARKRGE